MSPQIEGVLRLIKSALTGENCVLPKDFSVEDASQLGKLHRIEALLYHGGICCGLTKTDPGMEKLYRGCVKQMLVGERQHQQLENLRSLFRENDIRIVPLKGMILKELYPKPEMRWMGDADILICQEQYLTIKKILQSQGFALAGRTDHEIAWHHPHLRLELHTCLVPGRNQVLYNYFGDGWKRAYLQRENLYTMSPEDTLVFLVAHVAKHYTAGGIGIRQFVDLWLYTRAHSNLNQTYILQELEKIHLDKFYIYIMQMLQVWFADACWDPVSMEITRFIFESGCYGTHKNHILAQGVKQKSKARRILSALFPNYGEMKLRYPVLVRWPILLPFSWLVRGVNILLFHRKRISNKSRDLQMIADHTTKELQEHFDMLGLRSNL